MDLSQDLLLPILLAAIIVNAAIIAILLVSGRVGRHKRVATAADHGASFEGSLMSTSFSDRSASPAWPTPSTTSLANGHADDAESGEDDIESASTASAAATSGAEAAAMDGAEAAAGDPVDDGFDPLTGLPDASTFSHLVADEDARVARYHHAATIVIFELEGLDRLVERLGADAGDRVIPAVADTIRRLGRSADHMARIAPGRFATLLPETDEIAAINYVERVRRACDLWLESGAIALRLAIGWAGTTGDPTLTEVQRVATDRMYTEMRRLSRRGDAADDLNQTAP